MHTELPFSLAPASLLHSLQQAAEAALLDGATWYRALAEGDGLEYRFVCRCHSNAGAIRKLLYRGTQAAKGRKVHAA